MPTVNELVALGNHSYTPNLRNGDAGPAGSAVLRQLIDKDTGFQATAYRLPDGAVVVAYAGSNDRQDWLTQNPRFVFPGATAPSQFGQGVAFLDPIADENPGARLYVTGHSLGGAIAQYVTYARGETYDLTTLTYGAPGIRNIIDAERQTFGLYPVQSGDMLPGENRILNIRNWADPVSWVGGDRLGHTETIEPSVNPGDLISTGFDIYSSVLFHQHSRDLYARLLALRDQELGSAPPSRPRGGGGDGGDLEETLSFRKEISTEGGGKIILSVDDASTEGNTVGAETTFELPSGERIRFSEQVRGNELVAVGEGFDSQGRLHTEQVRAADGTEVTTTFNTSQSPGSDWSSSETHLNAAGATDLVVTHFRDGSRVEDDFGLTAADGFAHRVTRWAANDTSGLPDYQFTRDTWANLSQTNIDYNAQHGTQHYAFVLDRYDGNGARDYTFYRYLDGHQRNVDYGQGVGDNFFQYIEEFDSNLKLTTQITDWSSSDNSLTVVRLDTPGVFQRIEKYDRAGNINNLTIDYSAQDLSVETWDWGNGYSFVVNKYDANGARDYTFYRYLDGHQRNIDYGQGVGDNFFQYIEEFDSNLKLTTQITDWSSSDNSLTIVRLDTPGVFRRIEQYDSTGNISSLTLDYSQNDLATEVTTYNVQSYSQTVSTLNSAGQQISAVLRDNAGQYNFRFDPGGTQRWLGKFGQVDNWISCLTAAMLLRTRREHDEANETDPQPCLQGEGGAGGDQG